MFGKKFRILMLPAMKKQKGNICIMHFFHICSITICEKIRSNSGNGKLKGICKCKFILTPDAKGRILYAGLQGT